jgi:hypothetical protein
LVNQTRPEKLWEGVFEFPTTYFEAFPSQFGTRRSYNGSDYSYYHTGLDLYGSTQTQVLAPARGVVVYAGFLTRQRHLHRPRMGVFSASCTSLCSGDPGDTVTPGQVIGYVGGTGRVTAPFALGSLGGGVLSICGVDRLRLSQPATGFAGPVLLEDPTLCSA